MCSVYFYGSMVCGLSAFTCMGVCVMLSGNRRVSSKLYIWLSENSSFM